MNVAEIIPLLEAAISDIPTLITIIENLISIYKSGTAPTADQWASLNALAASVHNAVQTDGTK
ncbi:hypothetical protein [Novacetimonas hansenii]|uniref:Uncharacterized protein n=1 Tax=Novacetimonas hansenii TaxID=436 RepID=A0ABQ0SHI7_NOVHA|nr:hypothetical protein [Novacetimonas hansenii]GAN84018.1 hypothetical protein Gaha_0122_018 [Novacetimonas hansenii JCM 7643]GBQ55773.1 hypothetical protein AA0243_1006 [Novacetimonas hansenii NRIC 0243]GEC64598.1 hypothetical protein GHA01_24470 [Novacetimonas hansenii]